MRITENRRDLSGNLTATIEFEVRSSKNNSQKNVVD